MTMVYITVKEKKCIMYTPKVLAAALINVHKKGRYQVKMKSIQLLTFVYYIYASHADSLSFADSSSSLTLTQSHLHSSICRMQVNNSRNKKNIQFD